VTSEQLIEVRNKIVSSIEGEVEEAGSGERVAGTEMSDKKSAVSERDDEEDDDGSEDASMKVHDRSDEGRDTRHEGYRRRE
jgi:hypothetical protein